MQNIQKSKPVTTLISLGDIRASGIRSISALLKDRGWISNIVLYKLNYSKHDIPTKKEEDILMGLLKDLNTDIVGISVKTPFLKTSQMLTKRIKDEVGAAVVWGGSHPTVMPEDSIHAVDIICRGEGEHPFLELVEKKARGESIDDIQNLWIRKNGDVVRNDIRPLLQGEDMDLLPFMDCGGNDKYIINNETLIHGDALNRTLEYYPMASRGCPFTCSYCINGVLKEIYQGCGPFVRTRSPQNVVDEIVGIRERFPSVKRIRFQDEVFPWNMNWIKTFCEEYRQKVNLPFLCTFHPNTIKEDAVSMLKDAGLMVVGFGMQSPSERVRREVFKRPETNKKLLESIEILHRHGIDGFYDIILDNPFETESDKKEGLDFLLKLPKPFNISAFALKFFPSYKITEEGMNKGLTDETEVKAIGQQGYFEMVYNWYSPRKKEDLFWNCIYILTSRSILPRALVKFMSESEFLEKNPEYLVAVVKMSGIPDLFIMAIRRLLRGQLNLISVLKVIKSKIFRQTI